MNKRDPEQLAPLPRLSESTDDLHTEKPTLRELRVALSVLRDEGPDADRRERMRAKFHQRVVAAQSTPPKTIAHRRTRRVSLLLVTAIGLSALFSYQYVNKHPDESAAKGAATDNMQSLAPPTASNPERAIKESEGLLPAPEEAAPTAVEVAADKLVAEKPRGSVHSAKPRQLSKSLGGTRLREQGAPPELHAVPTELDLLEAAHAFLPARPDKALELVGDHEHHYPRGELVEEREAIAVESLFLSGRDRAARNRMQTFQARYSKSIYLPRLEKLQRN